MCSLVLPGGWVACLLYPQYRPLSVCARRLWSGPPYNYLLLTHHSPHTVYLRPPIGYYIQSLDRTNTWNSCALLLQILQLQGLGLQLDAYPTTLRHHFQEVQDQSSNVWTKVIRVGGKVDEEPMGEAVLCSHLKKKCIYQATPHAIYCDTASLKVRLEIYWTPSAWYLLRDYLWGLLCSFHFKWESNGKFRQLWITLYMLHKL